MRTRRSTWTSSNRRCRACRLQDRQLARPPTDVPAADGIDEVREAFARFDGNGDGRMDASGLGRVPLHPRRDGVRRAAGPGRSTSTARRARARRVPPACRCAARLRAGDDALARKRHRQPDGWLRWSPATGRYPSEIGTETEAEIGATSDLPLPAAPMEGVEIVFARYDKTAREIWM